MTLASSVPRTAPAAVRDKAWALKQACYAAWNSAPTQAAQAAQDLRRLADTQAAADDALHTEVVALADWTEGIAHFTQGKLEAGCTALERAAAGFRAIGQALHAAQTQVPLIMGLTLLGRGDEAARVGDAAEPVFLAHGDVRAAAKLSLNLGSLQLRRDASHDAARHYHAAAVRFARVGDHEHSVMADIGLADARAALGQVDEARRMLARARMRADTHRLPVLLAMADESGALLALASGRYRDALAGLERGRRAYEALQMPQQHLVAEQQLADVYLELRLLPEALALYGRVVQRLAQLEMPTEQAWTLARQGRALALSGRGDQAQAVLQQAAQLFQAQAVPSGLATVTLARAELALGQVPPDAPAALALAASAAASFGAIGAVDNRLRAEALHAQALLAQGRLGDAGAAFAAVLSQAQHRQLLRLQAQALAGQGQVAEAEGRCADAATAYARAVALAETQRGALPGDEIRSAFLADHLLPYQGLLRLGLAGAAPGDGAAAAQVLQRLDSFRARALAERLQQGPRGGADPDTDALRARLNWLYRRQQRLQDEGSDGAALTAPIQAAEHELLERGRRRRLASAEPPPPGLPAAPLDSADLTQQLQPGDAVVAYGVDGDELFACIATARGVQLVRRLAGWAAVQQALRSLRFQLDTLRVGAAPVAPHLPLLTQRALARLQQVHALVWAPLAPALQHTQRVLVVPQGPLAAVPFAALHDGRQALVQQHQLAMAPSVQVALHGLRRRPRPPQRVRAFGTAGALPHAATEAVRVAQRFAGGQAFTGDQATLAAQQREAPSADLLHLACHAQFRGDNPMFSALHLADGALTAEAVERLQLPASTVVLSGCDTAMAGPDAGDDRVGLVRAFLAAGAARVLASLWPVDDALTEVLMQRLHGALAAGLSPAAALRQAQLSLLAEQPHPCHWAAFTLHGGW